MSDNPQKKPPKKDRQGPYHIVNRIIGKHIGPFTSHLDAILARSIGDETWRCAQILNRREFNAHLTDDQEPDSDSRSEGGELGMAQVETTT